MPADFRLPDFTFHAPAGVTLAMEFISPSALTSLSVYLGGTLADLDDFTGATEYTATIGDVDAEGTTIGVNRVASVEVDIPANIPSTPTRLVINDAVETSGQCIPDMAGRNSPSTYSVTLTASTITVNLTIPGVVENSEHPGTSSATSLWVGAGEFSVSYAAPNLAGVLSGQFIAWALDASAVEKVNANVVLPAGWATFDVDVWIMNATTTAGDVVLRCDLTQAADGGELSGGTGVATTVAAPTASTLTVKVATVRSGVAAVTAAMTGCGILRVGSDSADTLPNDIYLLGVMLRKAS